MKAAPKKALKIRRALRTAARLRLPARVSGGRGSGRNTLSPAPGEQPVVNLRVQVQGCKDIGYKDKNSLNDAFAVVALGRTRYHTPVVRKTASPTFSEKESTFDFPIYLSLADKLGILELVLWDKDVLKKDYLGEASLSLEDWFKDISRLDFHSVDNKPFSLNLQSSRAARHVGGTIQIKIGFVKLLDANHDLSFEEIYADLRRRSLHADLSLVSAPPTESIGTVRLNQAAVPADEDEFMSSDEGEETEDEYYQQGSASPIESPPDHFLPPTPTSTEPHPKLTVEPPPTTLNVPKALKSPRFPKFPRMLPSRQNSLDSTQSSTSGTLPASSASTTSMPASANTKKKFRRSWVQTRKKSDYNFDPGNDILGIVLLEIKGAEDLPKLKNITRTGWDMDPFTVISFGKKVFRTRVIRHSLNPTWDEKVLFHVRRYESSFRIQLTVLDWDKLSSNDHVGDASIDVAELLRNAPVADEATGLYPAVIEGQPSDMQEFKLSLHTNSEKPWETKHNPVLTIRAKYQPYAAVRQRFWRQYLKQYDPEDIGRLSHLELTSMLDSLGSTLSPSTIDSLFTRHGKQSDEELTVAEAIMSLEAEICRPTSEKKRLEVVEDMSAPDTSALNTPMLSGHIYGYSVLPELNFSYEKFDIDFSGPPVHPTALMSDISADDSSPLSDLETPSSVKARHPTEPSQRPISDGGQPKVETATTRIPASASESMIRQISTGSAYTEGYAEEDDSSGSGNSNSGSQSAHEEQFERVINIKNCPLCHRPRMNSKAEMDIVTHLAVCASQDWARVDRIMVGNFVTANQAQRKWYTKVISKVSAGNYKIGANSANIIVQNRLTGQLEEEKMQVYVRLGIRLFYKGAKSRMEGARARRLLKSLSIKQGLKYDSPESAREIPAFIAFHRLNTDEFLEPLSSYKTFNQFFYRKLKPTARPVENPDDPARMVSAADCRLMAFETVNDATRLWIKGREFSVARLLGDSYREHVDRYMNGALAIFRLAPQDYHRFHSPVDGVVGPMTYISGEYYTVNPQAIRTALDVYGENVRKIVPIDSPSFGRVMMVCVGAMMVGSIKTTVDEGQEVKRGDELGYFAFGGSTIVALFERNTVQWDEDLIINGKASLETLVRVGMGIGRSVRRTRPKTPSPNPISISSQPK